MSIGGNWKTTLPAFSKRIKKSAELCTQITAKQIIDDAIKNTPVASGRLRAGWGAKAGLGDAPTAGKKASEAEIIALATAEILKFNMTDRFIVIENKVPYGHIVENGSMDRSPRGMLATALAKATTI